MDLSKISIFYIYIIIFNSETPFVHGSKLIAMLIDGFRYDYFDIVSRNLEGFPKIFQEGVRAEYMIPEFPTNSYPNFYTLMTGLHVDTHGIVGNYMFDDRVDKIFNFGASEEDAHSHWWDDGEPIWITAQKQGKKSYMYYWRDCVPEIRGSRPSHCIPYSNLTSGEDVRRAVDHGIEALGSDQADFIGIYHDAVDHYGHVYGPNSEQVKTSAIEIDREISYLLTRLQQTGLQDDVNVMIFSDHGMSSLKEDHVIDLTHVLDMSRIKTIIEAGTQVYIWPLEGEEEQVINDIRSVASKHLHIYSRDEMDKRWTFRSHPRVPPIYVTVDPGWYIKHPKSNDVYGERQEYPDGWSGNHGYDNNRMDMMAMFVAVGPDFKKNFVASPFKNVNLYQIMCHVLNITPSEHNGTWTDVKDFIEHRPTHMEL